MIWVLFKLIWENEERSEFCQHHCRNFEKKYERGEKNDVTDVGKRKGNFGNDIAKNKNKNKNN